MYTPALGLTATACGLIAVVVIPVAVFLGRRIALRRPGRRTGAGGRTGRRGIPPAAGRLGQSRPAHPAGRDPGDERGARGRGRRRTRRGRRLRAPDQLRDHPAVHHGRRPVRAVPDQRRRAVADLRAGLHRGTGGPGHGGRRAGRPPAGHPAHRVRGPGLAGGAGLGPRADPGAAQPAGQRDPAHAVRPDRSRWSPGRPPTTRGWRCRTGAAASIRTTCPGCSTSPSAVPRPARPGPGSRWPTPAPGWGWRSRRAWCRRTAARSACATRDGLPVRGAAAGCPRLTSAGDSTFTR